MLSTLLATMLLSFAPGLSFYPQKPDDPKAVVLAAVGDGVADDTAAVQRAIDAVPGQGVVLLPEGRYRLTRTLVVPPGVRLVGYGAKRPAFVLAPNTPGYERGESLMVFFSGRRGTPAPGLPANDTPLADFGLPNDANPGTFYSGISNVDLEIGEGNPAAVGIRGRYAQHGVLAHMDFRLRSGLAAIHDTGNFSEDLRFFGGEYGLVTRTPSPGWQFTLRDAVFEGQSKSAILTRTTGLTLVSPTFRRVPTAVEVDVDHSEQLWIENGLMEDVSGPALVVSRESALRTQINAENVACRNVPVFARMRESGKSIRGKGGLYVAREFSHGLRYPAVDKEPKVESLFRVEAVASLPQMTEPRTLPPLVEWASVAAFGAKGDGEADDTEALRRAVAASRVVYLPQGRYRVTDTLTLRPDTILVGLNPITTQIVLKDATPAYAGTGGRLPFPGLPKALLETPKGGTNVVTGIGLDTGGNNPAAVAALWPAGADSLLDDVKFVGGHGSNVPVYNADHTGDPDPARRWDSQYPSLWVTDGGGGTFQNLWTASTFAAAGMLVSDTDTPGRVYEMSSEHHVRHEVQVRNAAHWRFVALQTEAERGESSACLPLQIERSRDILVANLNVYRVVSVVQPFRTAVEASNSEVRFRGVHCYSNSKASFDNLLIADGRELRQREFATLDISPLPSGGERPGVRRAPRVRRLATGFSNISGGTVGLNGDLFFVEARNHRILRWDGHTLTTVSDAPLSPVNLLCDRSGNLIVVSYAGKGVVYNIPLSPPGERGQGVRGVSTIQPQPASPRPDATAYLPTTDWILDPELLGGKHPHHFVSPDGSAFLPAPQSFVDGALTWGVKLMDTIRTFGFAPAAPGKPFYVTEESGMRTYVADVLPDGSLSNAHLFCEQGGEGVAAGLDGRVYLAAGQVFVYSPSGKLVDTIRVPERPIQVLFGGKDGRTLFILARTSLYTVNI